MGDAGGCRRGGGGKPPRLRRELTEVGCTFSKHAWLPEVTGGLFALRVTRRPLSDKSLATRDRGIGDHRSPLRHTRLVESAGFAESQRDGIENNSQEMKDNLKILVHGSRGRYRGPSGPRGLLGASRSMSSGKPYILRPWGYGGRLWGSIWGAWGGHGGVLEAPGEHLGGLGGAWGALGGSFGGPWGSLGVLGGAWGGPWGVLGDPWGIIWGPLGIKCCCGSSHSNIS